MESPYVTGAIVDAQVGLLFATADGRSNAMTLAFFSEVAHHPTSLWVSVAIDSLTYELIETSGRFSLATSVLRRARAGGPGDARLKPGVGVASAWIHRFA